MGDVDISRSVFLKGEVRGYLGLDEILQFKYLKVAASLLGSVVEYSAFVTFQHSTLDLLDS